MLSWPNLARVIQTGHLLHEAFSAKSCTVNLLYGISNLPCKISQRELEYELMPNNFKIGLLIANLLWYCYCSLLYKGEDLTIGFADAAEFRLAANPFASCFVFLVVCTLAFSAAITNLERGNDYK